MLLFNPKSILIFLLFKFAFSRMLKFEECNLFDAEFSKVKRGYILPLWYKVPQLKDVSLLKCLSACMYHPKCFSVNYSPSRMLCHLLETATYMCGGGIFYPTPDWDHYETKDKKAVSFFLLKLFFHSFVPLSFWKCHTKNI